MPQRGRGGLSGMFVMRAAALAAVVATAAVIGLGLSQVIRPAPIGDTPPPVSSPTPSSAEESPSPSAATTPAPPDAAGPGRIVFQANRSNETSGIYVMDADGSNVAQVVDDPAFHETDPTWSPDGSLIAYSTMAADGSITGGVFLIDPDGGQPVQVDDAFAYSVPVWSPDGSMLALAGNGEDPTGIGVYSVDSETLEQLTTDGGTNPTWSPDGTRIAYDVSLPSDVRIVDVETAATRDVTSDAWNDSVARWTADGSQIVFVSDRDTDQARESRRAWIIGADGSGAELLGEPAFAFAHWPSPDGAWLAYGADDGLHLARADGSDDRLVSESLPADRGPSWSDDSTAFVFSSSTEEPREILVMGVDADAPTALTDDPADDSAPNWGPGASP